MQRVAQKRAVTEATQEDEAPPGENVTESQPKYDNTEHQNREITKRYCFGGDT